MWVGPRFEPWRFRTEEKENYTDYKCSAMHLGGSPHVVRGSKILQQKGVLPQR